MSKQTQIEVLAESSGDPKTELALSVLEGLSSKNKSLPSKLFYDDKGSRLFQQIMGLKDYYPTRCEAEILKTHSQSILAHIKDADFNLVELGCGDGAKTILLLDHILEGKRHFTYVPLDISKKAIDFLLENLNEKYGESAFPVQGLVADYFQGLDWITHHNEKRNLVLFLGSNIGNFNKSMAMRFLRHLWYSLNDGDHVLIGFDLKKDLDTLYYAYNDSEGVTKEFNLNVLDRINSVLNANFERKNFIHQGLYNVQNGAMESYLISQCKQKVYIGELGKEFIFRPWEPLHMEYSYKYIESDIEELATSTGFEICQNFKDSQGLFVDSLWKVLK